MRQGIDADAKWISMVVRQKPAPSFVRLFRGLHCQWQVTQSQHQKQALPTQSMEEDLATSSF